MLDNSTGRLLNCSARSSGNARATLPARRTNRQLSPTARARQRSPSMVRPRSDENAPSRAFASEYQAVAFPFWPSAHVAWSGAIQSCRAVGLGGSWTKPATSSSAHSLANDVSLAPSATANRWAPGSTAYASSYSFAACPDFGAHHAVAVVSMTPGRSAQVAGPRSDVEEPDQLDQIRVEREPARVLRDAETLPLRGLADRRGQHARHAEQELRELIRQAFLGVREQDAL